MPKIKIHPLAVKFEEVECCALKTAIANISHRPFIQEGIEKAKEAEPKHKWSILTEVFKNTLRLVFIPGAIHRNFYFNLAVREKKQITESNGVMVVPCNHSAAEHIKALDNICFMMACPKGEN